MGLEQYSTRLCCIALKAGFQLAYNLIVTHTSRIKCLQKDRSYIYINLVQEYRG